MESLFVVKIHSHKPLRFAVSKSVSCAFCTQALCESAQALVQKCPGTFKKWPERRKEGIGFWKPGKHVPRHFYKSAQALLKSAQEGGRKE